MNNDDQKRILTWMQTISDLMDKEIAPWLSDNTTLIYSPDRPLKCGAKVWIETTEKVIPQEQQ